ncbi:MAG: hypothetical protein ACRC8J_09700 [Phocaeicola sp.]
MKKINHNNLEELEASRNKKCKVTYILEGFPNEEYTGMLREIEFNKETNAKRILVEVKGCCIAIGTDRIISLETNP